MSENFEEQTEEILESLSLFLGLEDLEFGEEDETCTLQLDEQTQVHVTRNPENDTIILHHLVGTLPSSYKRAEIVEQLLEANLFWSGTQGATISIERETGIVILARALTIYSSEGFLLTGESLGEAIASVATVAHYWKQLLENPDIETTVPEAHHNLIQKINSQNFMDIKSLN